MAGEFDSDSAFGWLVGLVFVAILIYWGYVALDTEGYLPHKETAAVWAAPNWMVGETRDCYTPSINGSVTTSFVCDVTGEMKQSEVTFYGRLEQPAYDYVQWRCTRNDPDAFTCKQLDGTRQ